MAEQLLPYSEFHSWDYSRPHTLTCKNHPEARFHWKGPGRNIHIGFPGIDCPCPIADLLVYVQPEDAEWVEETDRV